MGGVVSSIVSAVTSLVSIFVRVFAEPPKAPAPFVPPDAAEDKAELIRRAREKYGIDATGKYNFAIAGASGTGKSTFINLLRGLRPEDPGWAEVGERECTSEIKAYPVPGYEHVVLWDIPGGDTDTRPAPTYFRDHSLYAFDAILVFYHNRVYASCTNIAQGCQDWRTQMAFVRNKADADISGVCRRTRCGPEDARRILHEEMQKQIAEKTGDKGTFARRFLISAENTMYNEGDQFDMRALMDFVAECGKARHCPGNP